MSGQRIVIVGASLAGATAAVGLRSEGFADDVLLIGAESQLPYHRPPLSKEYLRGEQRVEDTLVNPARTYAEKGIELRLGVRATTIEPRRKLVELEGGERVAYDRLLVATGARNRTLSMPGAALDDIFQLRTVEDCDRIRAAAKPGRRAVLIGLGFIGSEVTASLRQLGVEVTAVDGQRAPLARVLGEEVGAVLAEIHRDKGAELLLEDGVAAFEGVRRVERVRTRKGRLLACDFVVAGVGVTPNTELLAAAGGEVNNGILVDEHCRTSLPDVYAAGDVTNHHHPIFGRLRVEHWNNAYRQGLAAARSMVGGDQPYDYLHSFWSNQYEHTIEYVGFATAWDRIVFNGRPQGRRFLAFYLKDGLVRAVAGLDRGGDPEDQDADAELTAAAKLIRDRIVVDPARLADEDLDLRRMTATGAR